jgi:hypothetical protein
VAWILLLNEPNRLTNACDRGSIRDRMCRNNYCMSCIDISTRGTSHCSGHFVMVPFNNWGLLLWDILSSLHSVLGRFVAASQSILNVLLIRSHLGKLTSIGKAGFEIRIILP